MNLRRYMRRGLPRYGMPGDSTILINLHTNLDLTVALKFEGPYACGPSNIDEIGASKDTMAAARVK